MSKGLIIGVRLLKGSDSIKIWSLTLDGVPGFSLATKREQFCSDMISCYPMPTHRPLKTSHGEVTGESRGHKL